MGGIGGELDAPTVGSDQFGKPRLVDGDPTVAQQTYLAGVDVHGHDFMAQIGHAGGRDQTHISGADYRQPAHASFLLLDFLASRYARMV